MAKYFSYFPSTRYKLTDDALGLDVLTNLMARFKLEESFKENTSVYYKYDIRDGDTPETVAYYAYGSVERHWMVLLYNNIIDPQFDWPLQFKSLTTYVNEKYSANNYADTANTGVSGLVWAKTNNHSYYVTETTQFMDTVSTNTYEIDSATFANTTTTVSPNEIVLESGNRIYQSNTKTSINYYEYEDQENEKKRSIKLLKNDFVFALEEELRRSLQE
jgi:hypothetical protein